MAWRDAAGRSGGSPQAGPITRSGLCSLAMPSLNQVLDTRNFHFREATLVLVLQGAITIATPEGTRRSSLQQPLLMIDADTTAHVSKYPAAEGLPFQSLYLTLTADMLDLHRRLLLPAGATTSRQIAAPVWDQDLHAALNHVHHGVSQEKLSDGRLQMRLMELLQALSERGHHFVRPGRHHHSQRLRELIAARPGHPWTAAAAAQAMAMSAATLRRRLAVEQQRFEALLSSVRMQHGLLLLQTTHWSLQAIAQASGYRSTERFSKRFKACFGHSPTAVRHGRQPLREAISPDLPLRLTGPNPV
ncbi:helix-turn-helix domain-containing protein [Frateuria aurantia]